MFFCLRIHIVHVKPMISLGQTDRYWSHFTESHSVHRWHCVSDFYFEFLHLQEHEANLSLHRQSLEP